MPTLLLQLGSMLSSACFRQSIACSFDDMQIRQTSERWFENVWSLKVGQQFCRPNLGLTKKWKLREVRKTCLAHCCSWDQTLEMRTVPLPKFTSMVDSLELDSLYCRECVCACDMGRIRGGMWSMSICVFWEILYQALC